MLTLACAILAGPAPFAHDDGDLTRWVDPMIGTLGSGFVFPGPAAPYGMVHVIGSPVFETASIARGSGRFVVEAPGASLAGKHVQSGALNSEPLDKTWLTHEALIPGGSLHLDMRPIPNLAWGTTSPPPSMSTHPLADFGCQI